MDAPSSATPYNIADSFPQSAVLIVRAKSVDDLPDHIKENPSPGHWAHVSGVDKNGDVVNYWCNVQDEEGREALGRRVVSAAYGSYEVP